MKLSVVMPARNEVKVLEGTLLRLHRSLHSASIVHEILVVDDHSTDGTLALLNRLRSQIPTLQAWQNVWRPGFGFAVRFGIGKATGEAVAIFMADNSDDPADLVRYYREMTSSGVDCVFGSRFTSGACVVDYPPVKWILNRFANRFIQILFGLRYNDVTNAFKLYRRTTLEGLKPYLSSHFNLTVELPLKAIIRGYSFSVIPNSWTNRKTGVAKLKIREMSSRYLFIVLYCFLERWLSRGDYHSMGKPASLPSAENRDTGT